MNKQIVSIILIMLLFGVPIASASPLDSLGTQLTHIKDVVVDNLKSASLVLPSVSTIFVQCESGASCNLAGDNFVVDMLVSSSASKPHIQLTLQPGVEEIGTGTTAGQTWKTQSAVRMSLLDKGATLSVPTAFINVPCGGVFTWSYCKSLNYDYFIWDSWGVAAKAYQVPAYRPTQYSNVITTNYEISLDTQAGNLGNKLVSYNYLSPESVTFTDNLGNKAVISPMYQTNHGINAEVSGRIFVDNGFGSYYLFDDNAFKIANSQVWDEQQYCSNYGLGVPCALNWPDWYQRILHYTSPMTMANGATISAKSGNNMIIKYPAGAIGTKVQAVISKKMAASIQVLQSYGMPQIDSVTSSTAIKGQTKAMVTVKVTNKNTGGSDNFQVTLNSQSYGFNIYSVSSPTGNILSGGQQGTWVFEIDPTGISQANCVNMVATATSSGGQDTKPFQTCVTIPNPTDQHQDIIITAYDTDGKSVLSNAPIIVGGNQVGLGQKTYSGIVGQTYLISTNNISNPTLYAPTPTTIILANTPATVGLYFKDYPQDKEPDYTWVFWVVILIIIGAIGYFTGWYRMPTFWIGLAILFILYELYSWVTSISFSLW